MPVLDGITAAEQIADARIAPVVILTAFSQRDLVERARDAGAMAYLVKPFTKADLLPAIEIAMSRYAEIHALETEVDDLTDRLEARKLVERAKGVLQTDRPGCPSGSIPLDQKTSMDAAPVDARSCRDDSVRGHRSDRLNESTAIQTRRARIAVGSVRGFPVPRRCLLGASGPSRADRIDGGKCASTPDKDLTLRLRSLHTGVRCEPPVAFRPRGSFVVTSGATLDSSYAHATRVCTCVRRPLRTCPICSGSGTSCAPPVAARPATRCTSRSTTSRQFAGLPSTTRPVGSLSH